MIGTKRLFAVAIVAGLLGVSCASHRDVAVTDVRELPSSSETSDSTIAFLERRTASDPEDVVSLNRLANAYLLRLRETGNHDFIELAEKAARASLASVPAEANTPALALLARSRLAMHHFNESKDLALQLLALDPANLEAKHVLADSLVELGAYDEVARLFAGFQSLPRRSFATETRLGRWALLNGKPDEARRHLERALQMALDSRSPAREPVAWCWWQLGELAFARGEYSEAQKLISNALIVYADYTQALASLGKARAARGDVAGAIAMYEQAIENDGVPAFRAALADLYEAAGRPDDAREQFALIEEGIASPREKRMDRRLVAMIYADHDMKAGEAYVMALEDWKERRDIHGADLLAWTALKAGRIEEARTWSKQALRLGTRDARLLYHAGAIAHAAGDRREAKRYLSEALEISPRFDFRQAPIAERLLREVSR